VAAIIEISNSGFLRYGPFAVLRAVTVGVNHLPSAPAFPVTKNIHTRELTIPRPVAALPRDLCNQIILTREDK
jgi:hypothetical protein